MPLEIQYFLIKIPRLWDCEILLFQFFSLVVPLSIFIILKLPALLTTIYNSIAMVHCCLICFVLFIDFLNHVLLYFYRTKVLRLDDHHYNILSQSGSKI